MDAVESRLPVWVDALKTELEEKKEELNNRLRKINANLRRGYDADSKERAQQFEDREVIDALGNEARIEIGKINEALARMGSGEFGLCSICGGGIPQRRLLAYPYALECIDCANEEERRLALRRQQ